MLSAREPRANEPCRMGKLERLPQLTTEGRTRALRTRCVSASAHASAKRTFHLISFDISAPPLAPCSPGLNLLLFHPRWTTTSTTLAYLSYTGWRFVTIDLQSALDRRAPPAPRHGGITTKVLPRGMSKSNILMKSKTKILC